MLNKLTDAVAVLALALTTTVSSASPIVNGRFEDGSFNGWTLSYPSLGYSQYNFAAVVDNGVGGAVIQGNYSALLVTRGWFGGVYCALDAWDQMCGGIPIPFASQPAQGPTLTTAYSITEIFNDGVTPVHAGPLLGQDIEARAGDHLQLDWRWLSNDQTTPINAGDNAGFFLGNGNTWIGLSAGQLEVGCGSSEPVTGFRLVAAGCEVDLAIPFDGLWTLYIAVGQPDDSQLSSGIMVDNVRLRNVPEPTTLALLSLGLAGLAFTRRRRQ